MISLQEHLLPLAQVLHHVLKLNVNVNLQWVIKEDHDEVLYQKHWIGHCDEVAHSKEDYWRNYAQDKIRPNDGPRYEIDPLDSFHHLFDCRVNRIKLYAHIHHLEPKYEVNNSLNNIAKIFNELKNK